MAAESRITVATLKLLECYDVQIEVLDVAMEESIVTLFCQVTHGMTVASEGLKGMRRN